MYDINDIIPCFKVLSNTTSIKLSHEVINNCDEPVVRPTRSDCFIKKYHHYTYESIGVVNCKYIKGLGEYTTHTMKRVAGKEVNLQICGICSMAEDMTGDIGREWIECEDCKQWYHCDCMVVELEVQNFSCGCKEKVKGNGKAKEKAKESEKKIKKLPKKGR